MSLLQQYHAEHKARQLRLGGGPKYQAPVSLAVVALPPPVERTRREYCSHDRPSAFVPMARRILRATAFEFNVSMEDITGWCRQQQCSIPRFVAIGLAFELTAMSIPSIGRWLGNRDHTTIISGRRRILGMLESEAFRNRFDEIKAGIARS